MGSDLIDLMGSSIQPGRPTAFRWVRSSPASDSAAATGGSRGFCVNGFLTGSHKVVLMEEIPNNHLVLKPCKQWGKNTRQFFPIFVAEKLLDKCVCSWNIVDPFSLSLCVLVAPRNVFFGGGFKYFSLSWENYLIWLCFFQMGCFNHQLVVYVLFFERIEFHILYKCVNQMLNKKMEHAT